MASRLELRHFPRSTGLAGAHTVITTAKDKLLVAELSGRGMWEANVAMNDPALAAIGDGDYLQYVLDGTPVFTGIYDSDRATLKHPNNEAGQDTVIGGISLIGEWRDAIVRAPTPPGSDLFGDVRRFDWSSPELDTTIATTDWIAASELYAHDDAPAAPKEGKPLGFPTPATMWIWSEPAGDLLFDPGISPFRNGFTLASAESLAIYVGCDDGFVGRLNGVDLGGNGKVHGWETVWRADVDLPAGTHTLAFLGENYDRLASTNSAGLIVDVWTLDESGRDDTLILSTDDTWQTQHYPDPLPGFTVGHVIRLLLEENQAEGVLTDWTLDFSDTVDSDGAAWPTNQAFSFDVGRQLLSVLEELAATHIDFIVDQAAQTLHAYKIDTAGSATSVATLTSDLEELGADRRSKIKNSLLVRYAEGQFEVQDATSVATHGNRWGYLALGVTEDLDAATDAADSEVARFKDASDQIIAVLNGRLLDDAGLNPFDAWGLGDFVTLLDRDLAAADYRALAVAISENDNAHISALPTLNSRRDEQALRVQRAIERMQQGTLDGRSLIASSPKESPGVRIRKAETQELEWVWTGGPIINGLDQANAKRRGSHPGRLVLLAYDWSDPPADSAVSVEWNIGGSVAFTHTLAVNTDPVYEYPSHLYNRETIVPTCTAADTVAEGLTAVATILFFI